MKMSLKLCLCLLLSFSNVSAQNKLVVIPLLEDGSIPLNNVLSVSVEGGDFKTLDAALDSILDATESNRYVIYVGPGVYEVSSTINLKSYVSIVGSGLRTTVFKSRIRSSNSPVFSCTDKEFITVSSISLELSSSVTYPAKLGFALNSCQNAEFERIKIRANGSSGGVTSIGMSNSLLKLNSSQVNASSAGVTTAIFLETSHLTIKDSTVGAGSSNGISKGLLVGLGASFDISDSTIGAHPTGTAIFMEDNSETFRHSIRNSEVESIFSNQELIYISHSSLRRTLGSGIGLKCVFTDGRDGNVLDRECKNPSP